MPKVGTVEKEQIRDSVWAAAARTLTALTGQPRTDLVGADNALWAHASRTLTAFNAQAIFDLPIMDSVYQGSAIATNVVADTFGSWVEISADVGSGKRLIGAIVFTTTMNPGIYWEIEFGEGAAAAEAAVARVQGLSYRASHAGYLPMVYYPLWKSLSNNARLSARARDNEAVDNGFRVSVLVA